MLFTTIHRFLFFLNIRPVSLLVRLITLLGLTFETTELPKSCSSLKYLFLQLPIG